MSEKNEQAELDMDIKSTGKKPRYIAYQITADEDKQKYFWTKIGVGFLHGDVGGLNILLNCLPIDGRITLRASPYEEKSS